MSPLELINKYKPNYRLLNAYDIRKVLRAVGFIANNGKVYLHTIGNLVDGNDWYDDRANERVCLAHDILSEMGLVNQL